MAEPNQPSVDVVVPIYGSWELTDDCLKHLAKQSLPHRVIVVDNCSPDDSCAQLRAHYPEVTLVEVGYNAGFAVACNAGVAAGSGEFVVLLNNDVNCEPDFLAELIKPFEGQQEVAAVAALLLRPDTGCIDSFGSFSDVTAACYTRCQGWSVEQLEAQLSALPELLGPCGAAAAYRRDAWLGVDGLDENIFMYGEEHDLNLRLRAAGYRVADAVAARGVHIGGATAKKASAWQRDLGGFSRGYLLRRYNLFRKRVGLRAAAMELLVVVGDLVLSKDLAAAKGRLRGWRAAKGLSKHGLPDLSGYRSVTFRQAVAFRRGDYGNG